MQIMCQSCRGLVPRYLIITIPKGKFANKVEEKLFPFHSITVFPQLVFPCKTNFIDCFTPADDGNYGVELLILDSNLWSTTLCKGD